MDEIHHVGKDVNLLGPNGPKLSDEIVQVQSVVSEEEGEDGNEGIRVGFYTLTNSGFCSRIYFTEGI